MSALNPYYPSFCAPPKFRVQTVLLSMLLKYNKIIQSSVVFLPKDLVLVGTFYMCSVRLFATPWTLTCLAPLSMIFSRQQFWSGLSLPTPCGLPDPGIEPTSPVSPALPGGFFNTELPGKPSRYIESLRKMAR